jgi:ATP-dependent RNA helicase RhlE
MTQPQRQAAFDGFRTGSFKILVATDIAARGIDVLRISHVINYDMPDGTDAYINRIGRTGRVGKTGDAFTFVTNEDTAMVRALEHLLNAPLQRRTLGDFDYRVCTPDNEFTHSPREIRRRTVLDGRVGNRKPSCSAS